MVYNILSMEASPGKMQEALDWIKRFYGYIKKAYGVQAQWMQPVTPAPGQARTIVVITPYDSLAAWAAHKEKCAKDPERNAFLREVEEKQYFVPNSNTISVYTVMS